LVFLVGWAVIYLALSEVYGLPDDSWGVAMALLLFAVAPALLVLAVGLLRREQPIAAMAALATAWLSFTTLFVWAA
jgi:hypothetical protein